MNDQEIAAQVRKAAAEFNAALDRANAAGIQTQFTIMFAWKDGRKDCSRIDLPSLKFVKDLSY